MSPEQYRQFSERLRRAVGRPTRPGVGMLELTYDGKTDWYYCPCCQMEQARQAMLEDKRMERLIRAGRRTL